MNQVVSKLKKKSCPGNPQTKYFDMDNREYIHVKLKNLDLKCVLACTDAEVMAHAVCQWQQ
jgi:hypothetical protein